MEDIYRHQAENYEKRWSAYLNHTHGKFLNYINTRSDDMLLDLSGGTGLLAQELMEGEYSFKKLVVNDPSSSMLEIAKNRLPDNENISYTNYRAENLDFPANTFDRIFCLNAFHFYKHQREVLNRICRLLKPGGSLCLLDWNKEGLFRLVNWVITFTAPEHIDTRSLPELCSMLKKEQFHIAKSDRWYWRYWKFLYVEAEKGY